jgi:hypothetical protein
MQRIPLVGVGRGLVPCGESVCLHQTAAIRSCQYEAPSPPSCIARWHPTKPAAHPTHQCRMAHQTATAPPAPPDCHAVSHGLLRHMGEWGADTHIMRSALRCSTISGSLKSITTVPPLQPSI